MKKIGAAAARVISETLREEREKFKNLAEKSLAGIYLLQDGVIKYANKRLAEIFGYTVKQIIGKNTLDLAHPEDRPIVKENIRKRIAGKVKSIRYSVRGIKKDKKIIYLDIYGGIIQYQNKPAIIGTLLDVTEKTKIERALREKTHALNEAQRIARVGSWVWDPVADKPIWSEEMFNIFGANLRKATLKHKDMYRLFTPESWKQLITASQKCVMTGKACDTEVELMRPDGSKVWAITRGERITDSLKPYFRGTLQDITEHKKAEVAQLAEKARYEAMVRSSIDGFWLIDPATARLLDVNDAYCKMSGYDREELLKMKISDLEAKETAEETFGHIKMVIERDYDRFESRHKRKDGTIFDTEISVSSLEYGHFYFAFIRDINERKIWERAQKEFVSIASHQLQSPLTTIRWYAERLRNKKIGELSDAQVEHLSEIHEAAVDMSKLITDLLNVSRIETGQIKIEPVPTDITKLIQETLKMHSAKIKKEECAIDVRVGSDAPLILLDIIIMQQALGNLLVNAINYSKPGGCGVRVIFEKRENDYLLTIKDAGIGIPADVQSRVFDKFFRANNAQKKKTKGTGLGLYITKIILETAACQIWFESKEDVGSTFYVSIPLKGMKMRRGNLKLSTEIDNGIINKNE